MPENIELIGSVRDTDGRTFEIHVDHGHVRFDWAGQRGFFDSAQEYLLWDYLRVATDYAADSRTEAAEAAFEDDDDPFGPEAYKHHQPDCICWDCKAAREDDADEPGPLELFRQEREEGENR